MSFMGDKLEDLRPGTVIERGIGKLRLVIIKPSEGRDCDGCRKPFEKDEKCVRHEKNNTYLLWECFSCYRRGK